MVPWQYEHMKNKNTTKQRIIELRRIELQKQSAVKRSLWDKGFWVPKK